MRYEVIESRRWEHVSGRRASLYGSAPWLSEADRANWRVVSEGWTVRNPYTGQIGACRPPFATREEAEAFAARLAPSRIGYGD